MVIELEMKTQLSQLPEEFNNVPEAEKSVMIASIVQRIDAEIAERFGINLFYYYYYCSRRI